MNSRQRRQHFRSVARNFTQGLQVINTLTDKVVSVFSVSKPGLHPVVTVKRGDNRKVPMNPRHLNIPNAAQLVAAKVNSEPRRMAF